MSEPIPLSAEDEAELREHHPTDLAYERCVICRLLATIDELRNQMSSTESAGPDKADHQ